MTGWAEEYPQRRRQVTSLGANDYIGFWSIWDPEFGTEKYARKNVYNFLSAIYKVFAPNDIETALTKKMEAQYKERLNYGKIEPFLMKKTYERVYNSDYKYKARDVVHAKDGSSAKFVCLGKNKPLRMTIKELPETKHLWAKLTDSQVDLIVDADEAADQIE